jgi:Uma2 family endonuclease
MSANPVALPRPAEPIVYPSSDGQPMADNMKQGRWISLLYENLNALFAADPNILVAPNNLWYPIEGQPDICAAPDVYVVFGRPKGDRDSYQQWREGDTPLTVVFEVLSPSNDRFEMADKLAFYDEHNVEEYYVYDPDTNRLLIYLRGQAALRRHFPVHNFVSPRLGIRFDLAVGAELVVRYPDGRPFVPLAEERVRADAAEERADAAEERAAEERRLRLRYRDLSRKARRGEATPDEIAELDQLDALNGA